MTKATKYLIYSQSSFFVMLVTCFLLVPKVITSNLGISYFGTNKLTIIPYAAGLLITCFFIIKAAKNINHSQTLLSDFMASIALLIFGVLLTPYSVGALFDRVHLVASASLFLTELMLSIWLVKLSGKDLTNVVLVLVQFIGAFIAFVSLISKVELMLTGQVIVQLTFGLILIRSVKT